MTITQTKEMTENGTLAVTAANGDGWEAHVMEGIHTKRDKNLLVVVAVEEYSRRHGISAYETLGLFLKYGITESIRQCYETLHTQDIYESVSFAEDILKKRAAS